MLWSGDAVEMPDGRSARLTANGASDIARIAARVIGRGEHGRCIVVADRVVTVRRLRVRLDPARRVLALFDDADRPLARREVRIGEASHMTSDAGSIDLALPLPPGTVVAFGGATVRCP